ncbi:hypothetical protein C0Q70_09286 [Pomacea canaliculata]|uniref:Uncharacterized protein n=1 Tax=Pomacea canaliculata TaxID=400727 RepID=A0A2T7P9C8_POMCA|nr:hypothetical protein C0Q70_09286 [Pomacea canaliculata]
MQSVLNSVCKAELNDFSRCPSREENLFVGATERKGSGGARGGWVGETETRLEANDSQRLILPKASGGTGLLDEEKEDWEVKYSYFCRRVGV